MPGSILKDDNSRRFAALMLSCAAGILCGAAVSPMSGYDAYDIGGFFLTGTLAGIISRSLRYDLMLAAVCFVTGFSPVMQPAEALLPFFCGTGFGLAGAKLCADTRTIPVFFMLIPETTFSAAIISLCARESMRMSSAVYKRAFTFSDSIPDRLLYCKKFAVIALLSLFAACADGVSVFLFRMFLLRRF
ncbi:MAG: hypothetical protein K6C13_04410 [Oscillospiraceae bacterium]|nr:hypothetical protein [Oscillospiraceae bacterium]